ncbi:type II toxin-antitoxin system RelE/ParE family toxin [Sphingomonas sp. 22176]|uniref:type II toxin-antitoxin system RelE/ParE family toxin n=1 Tax=Sphingomonas sp. 22176 TaxID=3453884 RepID=UPI003F83A92C
MSRYQLSPLAKEQIAEIYAYTHAAWGREQADRYYLQLFECFDAIVGRRVVWRRVAAEFGADGYFCRCGHHFVYWRMRSDDRLRIVTILHERMHQLEQFRAVWEP